MAEMTATSSPSSYPLSYDVEYPGELSRWLIFVKGLLAIPHFIILYALGIAVNVVTIIAWRVWWPLEPDRPEADETTPEQKEHERGRKWHGREADPLPWIIFGPAMLAFSIVGFGSIEDIGFWLPAFFFVAGSAFLAMGGYLLLARRYPG